MLSERTRSSAGANGRSPAFPGLTGLCVDSRWPL